MTEKTKKRAVLVGWDAADWQHIHPLLDAGQMPHLERLINDGVMGNLATMRPILSPMLWNTIATGKLPDQHGIHGFMERDPDTGGARPVSSLTRKVKAIWNILSQRGYRCNVVGWWASHPAEPINGCYVSQKFQHGKRIEGKPTLAEGTVHPPGLSESLAECVVFRDELTANDILPFIPQAAEIDQKQDKRLGMFTKVLSECASVQAVTTALMEQEPWDFTAVYFDAIDHFCHGFMGYHPPKMPNVPDRDFEIFKDVVACAYRFHDMMLGRLCQLAGDDAYIFLCSDHGFESGTGRPLAISNEPAGPADWHRDMGILVAKGPGLKKDGRIYGANLIDMTPTILACLGLPIGEDMQGRPLVNLFVEPPRIETIPTWEDVPGESGMHAPGTPYPKQENDELRKQFVDLGYVKDTGESPQRMAEMAQTEAEYNLAQVYLATARSELARPILEKLIERDPWELRFLNRLIQCYQTGGYHAQCLQLLEATYEDLSHATGQIRLTKAKALLGLGRREEAENQLRKLLAASIRNPDLLVQIGRVFLRLRLTTEAFEAFSKACELNPEHALAYQGLANVQYRLKDYDSTIDNALTAVGIWHHLPRAHHLLGMSLSRTGDYERAALALENACHLSKTAKRAHKELARIYRDERPDPDKAKFHEREYRALSDVYEERKAVREMRRHQVRTLPDIPTTHERIAQLRKERPMKPSDIERSGREFTIVSGLPRSGTSLMMQMLVAGGMAVQSDGQRNADVDNPEGYFEWEAIKNIESQPELLDEPGLEDRAIKIISMLLPGLPKEHNYRVIFMMRPIDEVAKSQSKMIHRRTGKTESKVDSKMTATLESHRNQVLTWLSKQENFEAIAISYPNLVRDPSVAIGRLVDFLGSESLPTADKMAGVIRGDLHRQTSNPPSN